MIMLSLSGNSSNNSKHDFWKNGFLIYYYDFFSDKPVEGIGLTKLDTWIKEI